jgi:hypothetical protein
MYSSVPTVVTHNGMGLVKIIAHKLAGARIRSPNTYKRIMK